MCPVLSFFQVKTVTALVINGGGGEPQLCAGEGAKKFEVVIANVVEKS